MDKITMLLITANVLILVIAYTTFKVHVKVTGIEVQVECSREKKGGQKKKVKEPAEADSSN